MIAHGSDASDHPGKYLDHGVDFVLNGEVEQSLTDLCATILHGRRRSQFPDWCATPQWIAASRVPCLRPRILPGPFSRGRRGISSISRHTGEHGLRRVVISLPM